MALVYADRVQETTTTTGTGTLTLAGAVSGCQTFAAIGDGNTCIYCIESASGAWEVGVGTYTSSGATLARTTVLASSNSGSAINLSAGTHKVYVTINAAKWTDLLAGYRTATSLTASADAVSGIVTIPLDGRTFTVTLDASIELAVTAPGSGVSGRATIILQQDSTGYREVSVPASWVFDRYLYGQSPNQATVVDVVSFGSLIYATSRAQEVVISRPLDSYSAYFAYSLRKLKSDYTGPAIKVRRSSDNLTLDVGFDGLGNLDVNALSLYIGSASAYIDTWYDQSGNSRNGTTAADTNEPLLVLNQLNGKPTVRFDGVDNYLLVSSGASIFQNVQYGWFASVLNYRTAIASGARADVLYASVNGSTGSRFSSGASDSADVERYSLGTRRLDADAFVDLSNTSLVLGAFLRQSMYANWAAANGSGYINGSQVLNVAMGTSGSTQDLASTHVRVGGGITSGGTPRYTALDMCEIIAGTTEFTTEVRESIDDSQRDFWYYSNIPFSIS
jgi:hypothetical protein